MSLRKSVVEPSATKASKKRSAPEQEEEPSTRKSKKAKKAKAAAAKVEADNEDEDEADALDQMLQDGPVVDGMDVDQDDDDEDDSQGISLFSAPALPTSALDVSVGLDLVSSVRGATQGDGDDDSEEENDEDDEDEEDEADDKSKKKSKRAKNREKKELEAQIAAREDALVDLNRVPETADDYERHLIGAPNSSYAWIRYMAFQLNLGEIDKARAIGERALKAINFREEQERFNIWVALLNLENTYGSSESLGKTFDRALSSNDHKKVYIQMAKIYERTGKQQVSCWAANESLSPRLWKKLGAHCCFLFSP
jgi:rRNA biogenesis protein RRP5